MRCSKTASSAAAPRTETARKKTSARLRDDNAYQLPLPPYAFRRFIFFSPALSVPADLGPSSCRGKEGPRTHRHAGVVPLDPLVERGGKLGPSFRSGWGGGRYKAALSSDLVIPDRICDKYGDPRWGPSIGSTPGLRGWGRERLLNARSAAERWLPGVRAR